MNWASPIEEQRKIIKNNEEKNPKLPSSAHGVTSPLLYEFFTTLRGEVWADKTSLSPPFFIEVSVSSPARKVSDYTFVY
jgi:hypothetical protein